MALLGLFSGQILPICSVSNLEAAHLVRLFRGRADPRHPCRTGDGDPVVWHVSSRQRRGVFSSAFHVSERKAGKSRKSGAGEWPGRKAPTYVFRWLVAVRGVSGEEAAGFIRQWLKKLLQKSKMNAIINDRGRKGGAKVVERAGYCPCCGAELEVESWCDYCGSVQHEECLLSLSPPAPA